MDSDIIAKIKGTLGEKQKKQKKGPDDDKKSKKKASKELKAGSASMKGKPEGGFKNSYVDFLSFYDFKVKTSKLITDIVKAVFLLSVYKPHQKAKIQQHFLYQILLYVVNCVVVY